MITFPNWLPPVGHFKCPRCEGGVELEIYNIEFRPVEVLKCDFCGDNSHAVFTNPTHNTMLDEEQAARLEKQRQDFYAPWRTATPAEPVSADGRVKQLARVYGRAPFLIRVIGDTGEY